MGVRCKLPLKYSIISAKGTNDVLGSGESTILDIAMDGVAFSVNHPVNTDDVLDLEISLPKPPAIKATGKIRGVTKVEDAYFLVTRFLNIKDKDRKRIEDFVFKTASDETSRSFKKFFKKQ